MAEVNEKEDKNKKLDHDSEHAVKTLATNYGSRPYN